MLVGRNDITEFGLTEGKKNMKTIRDVEGAVTPIYVTGPRRHAVDLGQHDHPPGGVNFGAVEAHSSLSRN